MVIWRGTSFKNGKMAMLTLLLNHIFSSRSLLGPSWGHLGLSWVYVGIILGHRAHLGPSSWGPSRGMLGHLERSWAYQTSDHLDSGDNPSYLLCSCNLTACAKRCNRFSGARALIMVWDWVWKKINVAGKKMNRASALRVKNQVETCSFPPNSWKIRKSIAFLWFSGGEVISKL